MSESPCSRLGRAKNPSATRPVVIIFEAGRSSQATLLGPEDVSFESLYLSKNLSEKVGALPRAHHRNLTTQMRRLDSPSSYGKAATQVS
jgi:hypothetical protein